MALFGTQELAFAKAVSKLTYCNPFLPERIDGERAALGDAFIEADPVWHRTAEGIKDNPNIELLVERVQAVVDGARDQLADSFKATKEELTLYEDLVLFLIYHHFRGQFLDTIRGELDGKKQKRVAFYSEFCADVERYLRIPGVELPDIHEPAHLFAIFFQLRRAFFQIFGHLAGASMAAARLRAQVWQSIFTHDIRRYRRVLFDRMGDISTLVTGPSGTGKELVARAIGLSRYIPFDDEREVFTEDPLGSFYPLNLSAMSPTLIESELFGHKKGSFTGAVGDRAGWLEVCPPLGTVFLDEIGELDGSIQVKLLRVLQTRTFQALGCSDDRHFRGKVITATNRDLTCEMREGRFREDLYYRLCSDIIVTPSLHDQLRERPEELHHLIEFIAAKMVGDESDVLTEEVMSWIGKSLGDGYTWPGNFRELEQCVRNVLIRGEYHPSRGRPKDCRSELSQALLEGEVTADELLRRYCTLVYSETANYEETARRLKLDRRTVKSKVDAELLERLRAGE